VPAGTLSLHLQQAARAETTTMGLVSGMVAGLLLGVALMAAWSRMMRRRTAKRVAKVTYWLLALHAGWLFITIYLLAIYLSIYLSI